MVLVSSFNLVNHSFVAPFWFVAIALVLVCFSGCDAEMPADQCLDTGCCACISNGPESCQLFQLFESGVGDYSVSCPANSSTQPSITTTGIGQVADSVSCLCGEQECSVTSYTINSESAATLDDLLNGIQDCQMNGYESLAADDDRSSGGITPHACLFHISTLLLMHTVFAFYVSF